MNDTQWTGAQVLIFFSGLIGLSCLTQDFIYFNLMLTLFSGFLFFATLEYVTSGEPAASTMHHAAGFTEENK